MNIDASEFSESLRAALRDLPDKAIKSYGISMDASQITVNFKDDREPLVVDVDPTFTISERVAHVVSRLHNYGPAAV